MAPKFSFLCAAVITLVLHVAQLVRCDYCTDSLALSSCPNLATDDQVDLSAYSGKWYEIGSTGSFKNTMEAGGICAEAQYTVDSSSSLKVVNSNYITATPTTTTSVVGISASSSMVCQQARTICSQLNVDSSFLKEGLSKVWQFQSSIASAYPTEAGSVSTAASQIQQASVDLGSQIDQLSTYVSQLQTANSKLSQTDGDASSAATSIKSTIDLANAGVTSMDSSYKTISSAQQDLINVAKGLFETGGAAVGPSLTLTAAASEVLGGALLIHTQVAAMSVAFAASSKAADAVMTDTTKPFYNESTISGTAAVNGSQGKLSVSFDPLPGKAFPGSYWILSVNGASSTGYDSALVYSCMDVLTGGVDQTLWVLSRTPTLAQSVTTGFLNLASSMGVYQDCDAPFVYTVRSDKCPS